MVKQHHSPSVCYYIGEGAPYYGVITYHYYVLTKLGSNSFVFFIWILVWVCDEDGCGYGGGDRFLVGVVATSFFFFFFFFFGDGVWYVGEEIEERVTAMKWEWQCEREWNE